MVYTKYDSKKHDARCLAILTEGGSHVDVCADFSISRFTFYGWKKKHESFRMAIEIGEAKEFAVWIKIGKDNLKNKEFNTAVWQINMKNRFGWGNKHNDMLRQHPGFAKDPIGTAESEFENGKITTEEMDTIYRLYRIDDEDNKKPITVTLNVKDMTDAK